VENRRRTRKKQGVRQFRPRSRPPPRKRAPNPTPTHTQRHYVMRRQSAAATALFGRPVFTSSRGARLDTAPERGCAESQPQHRCSRGRQQWRYAWVFPLLRLVLRTQPRSVPIFWGQGQIGAHLDTVLVEVGMSRLRRLRPRSAGGTNDAHSTHPATRCAAERGADSASALSLPGRTVSRCARQIAPPALLTCPFKIAFVHNEAKGENLHTLFCSKR
jgi:hypothetical protein